MAESYAPPDWKKALTGRQFERSGMQAYGAAKLFNIMLAKEYSKRLKVTCALRFVCHAHLLCSVVAMALECTPRLLGCTMAGCL